MNYSSIPYDYVVLASYNMLPEFAKDWFKPDVKTHILPPGLISGETLKDLFLRVMAEKGIEPQSRNDYFGGKLWSYYKYRQRSIE